MYRCDNKCRPHAYAWLLNPKLSNANEWKQFEVTFLEDELDDNPVIVFLGLFCILFKFVFQYDLKWYFLDCRIYETYIIWLCKECIEKGYNYKMETMLMEMKLDDLPQNSHLKMIAIKFEHKLNCVLWQIISNNCKKLSQIDC